MDIEQLNKAQIILLTLLVSFVTSIATGIVTVRLMEQAPPAVTQTINRVVERTVERVVPAAVTSGSDKTVIEKETTVVVKEDDLITASIENSKSTLARLVVVSGVPETLFSTTTDILTPGNNTFYGLGVFVGRDGLIATDASIAAIPGLFAVTSDGRMNRVESLDTGAEDTTLGLLKIVAHASTTLPEFKVVTLADTSALKLGQTVISLQGEARTNVTIGIVSDLTEGDAPNPMLLKVHTNITNATFGSPLINIFGEVVGIDTVADRSGTFTASGVITEHIRSLTKAAGATSTEAL